MDAVSESPGEEDQALTQLGDDPYLDAVSESPDEEDHSFDNN